MRAARRQMAGGAAAVLVVVAVVAGVLVTRSDPSSPPSRPGTTAPLAAVDSDNAFALDLYRQLAETEPANLFFSPHSISMAMALALAGVDGNTKRQLEQAMHLSVPEPVFHDAINALDQALTSPRPAEPGDAKSDPLELETANSYWAQGGSRLRKAFLDRLARSYDAGMNVVDFAKESEASREAINAWVAGHTDGKITELIPKGVINDLTRLVLVNTITFKASWVHRFDDAKPGPFTRDDGSTVTASMMAGGKGALADGDGCARHRSPTWAAPIWWSSCPTTWRPSP